GGGKAVPGRLGHRRRGPADHGPRRDDRRRCPPAARLGPRARRPQGLLPLPDGRRALRGALRRQLGPVRSAFRARHAGPDPQRRQGHRPFLRRDEDRRLPRPRRVQGPDRRARAHAPPHPSRPRHVRAPRPRRPRARSREGEDDAGDPAPPRGRGRPPGRREADGHPVRVRRMDGLLSRERIVAAPGFNRWWNVVAALAINLCIGQAYAFSVFNLPLTHVLGVSEPAPGDWTLSQLGWIFTLAYVFLGLSAGIAGKWQDRVGPRMSGVFAAACFGGGFFLSALGVVQHRIAWLYLGYGVVSGCGLGLGFNTPISTLLRWFPDRRGLATGAAVMGFGGGGVLAAPRLTTPMPAFAAPRT